MELGHKSLVHADTLKALSSSFSICASMVVTWKMPGLQKVSPTGQTPSQAATMNNLCPAFILATDMHPPCE